MLRYSYRTYYTARRTTTVEKRPNEIMGKSIVEKMRDYVQFYEHNQILDADLREHLECIGFLRLLPDIMGIMEGEFNTKFSDIDGHLYELCEYVDNQVYFIFDEGDVMNFTEDRKLLLFTYLFEEYLYPQKDNLSNDYDSDSDLDDFSSDDWGFNDPQIFDDVQLQLEYDMGYIDADGNEINSHYDPTITFMTQR